MTDSRGRARAMAEAVVAGEPSSASAERVVMTKLYATLGKLIGSNGLDALLTRGLSLAQREEPSLANAKVAAGGALSGLPSDVAQAQRALSALLAEVFQLLIRFIGEDLALRVIRDAWPDAIEVTHVKDTAL